MNRISKLNILLLCWSITSILPLTVLIVLYCFSILEIGDHIQFAFSWFFLLSIGQLFFMKAVTPHKQDSLVKSAQTLALLPIAFVIGFFVVGLILGIISRFL